MTPAVIPQLLANDGARALRRAIADPDRYACEPKVDGVRGLVCFDAGVVETRNRQGIRRDWLRGDVFESDSVASRRSCRSSGMAPYWTAN
jgi:hypothetical protein